MGYVQEKIVEDNRNECWVIEENNLDLIVLLQN